MKIMAALSESTAVGSPAVDVNQKEVSSDSHQTGPSCSQAISNKNPEVNDENICSTGKSTDDAPNEECENENKNKFIEAPIPKINPWTVNRNGPQSAGPLKPTSRHHFLGKIFL